jgi:hypothetical protein
MDLGIGNTLVEQPAVQLIQALHTEPRREEALADKTDLVLDLALFPARCRRARRRLDKIVAAHLQEATVVSAILAEEDRLNRRFHVVADAAGASALEEGKRTIVCVEHHLLRLARIRPSEHHPAVAERTCAIFTVTVVHVPIKTECSNQHGLQGRSLALPLTASSETRCEVLRRIESVAPMPQDVPPCRPRSNKRGWTRAPLPTPLAAGSSLWGRP